MASTKKKGNLVASRNPVSLTTSDAKVLGTMLSKKREKTMPPAQFETRLYKTLTSNWTPIVNKPSNEQIFKERRELISHWYDIWTDSQRKRFLDLIFRQCRRPQLFFIQNWFQERVPLRHLDFSKVLPNFLSLYIFSYLDPRSLCRAALVCWHWKFMAEQDVLWIPKCTRLGWYLPYTPADNEYAAWKRHYVACLKTLDMDVLSKKASGMYGGVGDGTNGSKYGNRRKTNRITPDMGTDVIQCRPPWLPTDRHPQDLDKGANAAAKGFNPNDPKTHPSLLMYHTKYGTLKNPLRLSDPGPLPQFGLSSARRRKDHRALNSSRDALAGPTRHLLSESLELENFEERRLMELMHMEHEPPTPRKATTVYRPNLSGGGDYPLPWKHNMRQPVSKSFPNQAHPRIIFISSRVPAADILVDAILFGVIPLVFEYEGTTLESLISQLDHCLQGRNAQSIGLFVHNELPWEMRVVHGATVTLDALDNADFVNFFTSLANYVVPGDKGGHVDLFVPLGATEPGMELLTQLGILTGVDFTCPTGVIGSYNHINSEWLRSPEREAPPTHYFCNSKLNVWANTADQVQEACKVTKKIVGRYFEQKHRDVVSQLVGQIIFDATGQVDIQGVQEISEALVDGLIRLGKEQNKNKLDQAEFDVDDRQSDVNSLDFLGRFLLDRAGVKNVDTLTSTADSTKMPPGGTLAPTATLTAKMLSEQLELDEKFEESLQNSELTDDVDNEVAEIHESGSKRQKEKHNQFKQDEDKDHDSAEEIEEEIEDGHWGIEGESVTSDIPQPQRSHTPPHHHVTIKSQPSTMRSRDMDLSLKSAVTWSDTDLHSSGPLTARDNKLYNGQTPRRLTAKHLTAHPEKRTPVAKEILASEISYQRTLQIIKNVFYLPLKAALSSNRGILSAHNLQIIFTDPLTLLDLSSEVVENLKQRQMDWGPQQCLGDIFVKFSAKMKAYVNFFNNYPVILSTIEKCTEQVPHFRAFLKRRERTAEAKMLTLAELMLTCTRRINEYVTLLTWFRTHTPEDHADRQDLSTAITSFTKLDNLIRECKERLGKEKELIAVQKKLFNCPHLLEANRFFIYQLDVAHLMPPSSQAVAPELRLYQHIETLGLFLFNDALVVARRTTQNFPYERCVEHNYRFESCVALNRLRLEDIADSKFVKNAFRMYTPKRSLVCAADSFDDKFSWMTLLENTIRAAVED